MGLDSGFPTVYILYGGGGGGEELKVTQNTPGLKFKG
jgi:hypothetical protein